MRFLQWETYERQLLNHPEYERHIYQFVCQINWYSLNVYARARGRSLWWYAEWLWQAEAIKLNICESCTNPYNIWRGGHVWYIDDHICMHSSRGDKPYTHVQCHSDKPLLGILGCLPIFYRYNVNIYSWAARSLLTINEISWYCWSFYTYALDTNEK